MGLTLRSAVRPLCRVLPVLAGGVVAILLGGCSGGPSSAPPAHERRAAAARTNEIIVAVQSDARTLDPHLATDAASMRVIENLYSTLVRYGEAYGTVAPDLAASWTVSDDGLTYQFRLRTNAVFHPSGRPVTAADAVYSLNRIRTEGARANVFAPVETVEAAGDHELVIRLATPLASLLAHLAHPMSAVVDREVAEGPGLERAAGGSGPFTLVEWKARRHAKLAAAEPYVLPDRPRIGAVTYRPIPDETARTTALRNGEVDILLDVAAKDIDALSGVPGVVVDSVPGTFWEYLGLNCTRPPFNDVRVRRAVAWAIDRHQLNQLVKFGRATVLDGGPIPSNHWAHAGLTVYPEPDIDRAKSLLADAGIANGFEVTLLVGSDFPYQVQAAEVIKQQLRAVGITVTVQALETGVFFNRLGDLDYDMAVVGWLGFTDPDEWLGLLFETGADWNQQGYTNPDLDTLIARGRATRDRDERTAIYAEAQQLVADDAPMVFLYVNPRTAARLADVEGFVTHPTVTTISLRDATLNR